MGRKSKKSRSCPSMEKAVVVIDGLSSLPDAILVDILTLLPLKSAVSTAVLSRRWRYLWTQTTTVDIHCRHFKDFYTSADQLLSQLTSPIIRNFTLCVPLKPDPEPESSSPARSLVIGSWLQRVCARNVEEIKVTTEGRGDAGVVIGTLPTCIFKTRSLVELDMMSNLDYKLPGEIDMNNINLPNLVKLRLNLYASQCGLVSKLIRCCPLLEDVFLNGLGEWEPSSDGGDGFVVDISNDNVTRLFLMLGAKVVIDAPKLTHLALLSAFLTSSFVRKPVSVSEAAVICSSATLVSLLPVIRNVSSLRAHPMIFSALNSGFSGNLTFPNLRHLHFHYGRDGTIDDLDSVDSVPARCLLLHVKTIVIQVGNVKNRNSLLNFSKRLLSSAPVLERLVFQVTDQSSTDLNLLVDEALFTQKLYGYVMLSSLCCEIEFFGEFIKLTRGGVEMPALAREIDHTAREMRDLLTRYVSERDRT